MNDSFVMLIAERTANVIGLDFTPEFVGWRKSRGHATLSYYNKKNVFVLPKWLKNENSYYQTAYIAHEICHFVDMHSYTGGHTKVFYETERKALAEWGMEPLYLYGKRYAEVLYVLGTGTVLWSKSTAKTKLRRSRLTWGEGR